MSMSMSMSMTLAELRNAAELYFRRHLAGEEWRLLAEETKQGALAGAEADVALYFDRTGIDPENPFELKAAFEQAIHLARKARSECGPEPRRRLVSEDVSGVGSRTWEYDKTEFPDYAPRALQFLRSAARRRFRIGRG